MVYVIMRSTHDSRHGAFVAPLNSAHSYVRTVELARHFATREAAEREQCPENECVIGPLVAPCRMADGGNE